MHPTLLIIDDSATLRQQVIETLENAGLFKNFLEAVNGIDGFKILIDHQIDVVLCDLEMPGMDGLKFLDMRNGHGRVRDTPVILLTGREGQEQKIRGLERGASDYVTKPFDPGELIARVKVQLKIKQLQDHLREQNKKLEELSNTDPLTQLANRRFLMQTLEKEFRRSVRNKQPLALIMADIDHFKRINDTCGHQQGDVVLKAVAEALTDELREYDLAARFGGEEFALLLPDTELFQAKVAAERIRKRVALLEFEGCLKEIGLTISLGVAAGPRQDIREIDDLVRLADDALYAAKREGRNRVVIADVA
ncbi:MAG TPA: diguanylate cyclase [Desulfuromonadales bacterium]|nr:diguanylate cyclase [Desulfuromonadales bacterium]